MPKPRNHDQEREPEHEPEHNGERHHHPERHRDESGDDAKRHASIIERRWLGSPPPTAERYALAVRQWHALPGAVVQPATDVAGSEDNNRQVPDPNPKRNTPANVESDT